MSLILKKTMFGALCAGALLASVAGNVFADDTTPTPIASPSPLVSPRPGQLIRQNVRKEIAGTRADIRSDRAKIHAARLQSHFAFYALRLNNINTRIQSLIDKKTTAGKNTTAAQTQLNTAKATLAQAIIDGNKAVDMFNGITPGTWSVQKPEIQAAITQAQLARKEFAQARTQSMQAVKLLKSL